jgi:uncharacterized membrane protein YgcG
MVTKYGDDGDDLSSIGSGALGPEIAQALLVPVPPTSTAAATSSDTTPENNKPVLKPRKIRIKHAGGSFTLDIIATCCGLSASTAGSVAQQIAASLNIPAHKQVWKCGHPPRPLLQALNEDDPMPSTVDLLHVSKAKAKKKGTEEPSSSVNFFVSPSSEDQQQQDVVDGSSSSSSSSADAYPGIQAYKQRIRERRNRKQQAGDGDGDGNGGKGSGGRGGGGKGRSGGRGDREYARRKKAFDDAEEEQRMRMIYGDDAVTRRDVGTFATVPELEDWKRDMVVIEQYYGDNPDDDWPLFGDDAGPYGFGTKIRLDTFETPLVAKVVGLKLFDEGFTLRGQPDNNDKLLMPYYIIKTKGDMEGEFTKAPLDQVHETWTKGWGGVPDDNEDELDDLLSIDSESEEEQEHYEHPFLDADEYDDTMNTPSPISPGEHWNDAIDGPIEEAFWNHSFTFDELKEYMCRYNGSPLSMPSENDDSSSSPPYSTVEARLLLMKIVMAWTRDGDGAVILHSERSTKYLAIEFNSPYKRNTQPMIAISFAIGYYKQDAETFLHGETTQTIQASSRAVNAVQHHIVKSCAGKGLTDVRSSLLLFNGRLSPIPPMEPHLLALLVAEPTTSTRTRGHDQFCQEWKTNSFGLEFELSCCLGTWNSWIAFHLEKDAHVPVTNVMDEAVRHPLFYTSTSESQQEKDAWQIVHDASLRKSEEYPNASSFELVSPILQGKDGLDECHRVLDVLNDVTAMYFNKSMAMHLHVGVEDFSLESLKNACDNYIKYEDVIDTFMPASRRGNSNEYCRSNKRDLIEKADLPTGTKKEVHARIQACTTKDELFDLVNPDGRYYKLNLQNLKTNRQPTIEFRQHSATSDAFKAEAWVRFCMALVHNSVAYTYVPLEGSSFDDSIEAEEEFEELFDHLIQDSALKQHYKIRREQLRFSEDCSDT